jgi:ATP-binding cassette subfamily B multidrug efflux pump
MNRASDRPLSFMLSYFFKHYRAAILTGVAAIILVDLAELSLPILLKRVIDAAGSNFSSELMHSTLLAVALIVFCQVVCRYLWRMSLARGAMRAGADFRGMFAKQIFEVPFSYFERKKVGDLMTLATSDVENMRLALGPGLISLIDSFFYCITIPVAMYFLAPKLMVRMLIPVLAIPVAVILLQKKIGEYSRGVQERIGKLGTQTQETVARVRLAKIYGAESRLEDRLNLHSRELNLKQVRLARSQAGFGPFLEFFLSIGLITLFGLGSSVSIGTLVAMQRYLQKLMWPMSAVGMSVVYFQKAKASGGEVLGFLDEEKTEKIEDEKDVNSLSTLDFRPGVPLIEAKNLNFRVIHNLSFSVFPGEWLGIEGKVASGKSTLFSLLLKFYDVPRGQLFVNGRDLNDWHANEVRHFFASVLQDPYLFQGSVRSNLEVGDDVELFEAMETAHVHGAIVDQRFDENLGEKGTGLSGGQKQRIAIARALRKPAPVLLFDDPLSSVDLHTSQKVLKSLVLSLKSRKKTVLFISHHPEHLEFCDRVIQL